MDLDFPFPPDKGFGVTVCKTARWRRLSGEARGPGWPTLLSRNSSRYLSSLALVILRNTDSRHFSDTVILPILRFRFFFPLPPGSLACFSPVAWRCWWLEGAGEGDGRQERLVRAVGSWGGLRLASGAWSQVQRTRTLCCHTLRSAARERLWGWGPVPKPCNQGLAHS